MWVRAVKSKPKALRVDSVLQIDETFFYNQAESIWSVYFYPIMSQWLKHSGHKLRFFIPTSLKPDDVDLFQTGHFDPAEFKG